MAETKTIAEQLTTEFKEFRAINEARLEAIEKKDEARTKELDAQLEKAEKAIQDIEAKAKLIQTPERQDDNEQSEEHKAFVNYLRKGDKVSNEDAQRLVKYAQSKYNKSLTTDSLDNGGVFSIDEFDTQIINLIRETSPVRQVATVKQISQGDAWLGSRKTSNSGANWVGERETNADTGTPKWKELRIQVHELEARPRISNQMVEDSVVNIEQELQADLAEEFRITENTAFVSGSGSGQPQGILTGLPTTQQVDNGALTLSADMLIEQRYSVKAPYMNNASWMMNRLTVAEVRKLKATDDNYLWQPGLSNLAPANILGAPYYMADDLVAPASGGTFTNGDKAVLYGDFGRGYYIVDRIGMQVLVDPYSAKPFIEYYTRKRTGGQVVDPFAINYLEMTT